MNVKYENLLTLSNNEISRLYLKGMTLALDVLCKKNEKLIWYYAKKYIARYPYLKDDIYGEGALGLTKAALTYDPDFGIGFASYCYKPIRNQILMFLRRERLIKIGNPKPGEVSEIHPSEMPPLSLQTMYDEESGLTLEDMISDPFDMIQHSDAELSFDVVWSYILNCLGPNEIHLFNTLSGAIDIEETRAVYAARLGISPSYVSQLYKHVLDKIRYRLYIADEFRLCYKLPEEWSKIEHHDTNEIIARLLREKQKRDAIPKPIILNEKDFLENSHLSIGALCRRYNLQLTQLESTVIAMGFPSCLEQKQLATKEQANIVAREAGMSNIDVAIKNGLAIVCVEDYIFISLHDLWDYLWKYRKELHISQARRDYPYPEDEYIAKIRTKKTKFL